MEDFFNTETPMVSHHEYHDDSSAACKLLTAESDRWWDDCDADTPACAFTANHEHAFPLA
jgi:hypothetical protein